MTVVVLSRYYSSSNQLLCSVNVRVTHGMIRALVQVCKDLRCGSSAVQLQAERWLAQEMVRFNSLDELNSMSNPNFGPGSGAAPAPCRSIKVAHAGPHIELAGVYTAARMRSAPVLIVLLAVAPRYCTCSLPGAARITS